MKLELKHLAPYLPYGLKGIDHNGYRLRIDINSTGKFLMRSIGIKPILRPLSDLTKEIEHNGEKFVPAKKIGMDEYRSDEEARKIFVSEGYCLRFNNVWHKPTTLHYSTTIKLFEWHFDVFGLIPEGLAIDINTINVKP